VDHLLGAYYLDSLELGQGDAIERHLDVCATCSRKADETIETVAALALLDERTHRSTASRPQIPPGQRPPPRRRDKRRPRGRKGRRRSAIALTLSGVLAAAVVVGVVVTVMSGAPEPPPSRLVTAAATGAGALSGATVSVSLTPREGGSDVRATVEGLVDGMTYTLMAVTVDGSARPVASWTGHSDRHDVTGVLERPAAEVASFEVTLTDGKPVVTVPLPKS
jgi:hypothetical protein